MVRKRCDVFRRLRLVASSWTVNFHSQHLFLLFGAIRTRHWGPTEGKWQQYINTTTGEATNHSYVLIEHGSVTPTSDHDAEKRILPYKYLPVAFAWKLALASRKFRLFLPNRICRLFLPTERKNTKFSVLAHLYREEMVGWILVVLRWKANAPSWHHEPTWTNIQTPPPPINPPPSPPTVFPFPLYA